MTTSPLPPPLDNPVCCAPTIPPKAAAYERHRRAGTRPCLQSCADSSAYRVAYKNRTKT